MSFRDRFIRTNGDNEYISDGLIALYIVPRGGIEIQIEDPETFVIEDKIGGNDLRFFRRTSSASSTYEFEGSHIYNYGGSNTTITVQCTVSFFENCTDGTSVSLLASDGKYNTDAPFHIYTAGSCNGTVTADSVKSGQSTIYDLGDWGRDYYPNNTKLMNFSCQIPYPCIPSGKSQSTYISQYFRPYINTIDIFNRVPSAQVNTYSGAYSGSYNGFKTHMTLDRSANSYAFRNYCLRVYDRALTESEIRRNFEIDLKKFGQ